MNRTDGQMLAALVSVNEADSNGEPANVVDGLFAIARAIDRLATATEATARCPVHCSAIGC